VPAILKFVVKLLRVDGKRPWILPPTKPYTTVHPYNPPCEFTAIQQKDDSEVMRTTGINELRGPKYRSARKPGIIRPRTPMPFKVIRRLTDSAYGSCIMERAKDPM
jgi:hypothetical protein